MDWCSIFEIRRAPISFLAHSWVLWERFVMQGIVLAQVVSTPLISKPQSTGFLSKLQIRSCFKHKVGMFLVYLTALWRWRDKTTNSSHGLLKRAHIRQPALLLAPLTQEGEADKKPCLEIGFLSSEIKIRLPHRPYWKNMQPWAVQDCEFNCSHQSMFTFDLRGRALWSPLIASWAGRARWLTAQRPRLHPSALLERPLTQND